MKKTFIVQDESDGMRLDRWIRNNYGNVPQGLIEKNLRNGIIKLNKKKAKSSFKLKKNDFIDIYNFIFKIDKKIQQKIFTPSKEILKQNEDLIIENNENFIVINKNSGIPVQGGTKSKKNLIDIFSKSEIFKENKPFTVHRLDKDTSGVLIFAKNRKYAQLLTTLFRLRKVHKTYLAICHGEIVKNKDVLKDDLVKFEGNKKIIEKAETTYKVLDKNVNATLIQLKPVTGRKHQLRKQLTSLGHPILGDKKYNFKLNSLSNNKTLMLHSFEIKFIINDFKHTYRALIPDHFKKMLKSKRLNYSNIL